MNKLNLLSFSLLALLLMSLKPNNRRNVIISAISNEVDLKIVYSKDKLEYQTPKVTKTVAIRKCNRDKLVGSKRFTCDTWKCTCYSDRANTFLY